MTIIILLLFIILFLLYILSINLNTLPHYNIEFSCKFTKNNPFNNSRYILLFKTPHFINKEHIIFREFNINKEFKDFYYDNSIKPIELILGFDNDISKIYFAEYNNNIYGLAKNKDKYIKRYYKSLYNLNKSLIDKFIGEAKSTILYKLFNIKDKNYIYEKYEDDIITSYHIRLNFYKIKDYIIQIKELLKLFECNVSNIDLWINKNKNYYIRWIGITKKNNNFEVTFYYRKEPK
jgi:hypothetical protein